KPSARPKSACLARRASGWARSCSGATTGWRMRWPGPARTPRWRAGADRRCRAGRSALLGLALADLLFVTGAVARRLFGALRSGGFGLGASRVAFRILLRARFGRFGLSLRRVGFALLPLGLLRRVRLDRLRIGGGGGRHDRGCARLRTQFGRATLA